MDAAARFPVAFDAAALAAEVPTALGHVAQVREIWPEIDGWVNFPLFNRTGAADDLMLALYPGPAQPTPQAATMPATAAVVRALMEAGFAVKQARIAVLAPGELLRCHVDMYPAARLIVPLNDQGDDFRHLFGEICVAMGAGELWGVAGDVCHGAAHVGQTGARVALLVDADPEASSPPAWFGGPWRIPAERKVDRRPLDAAERARLDAGDIEAGWLRAPFELAITAEEAYAGLVAACERRGLLDRAGHWRRHACVCVPEG